jgi:hypothetical protein
VKRSPLAGHGGEREGRCFLRRAAELLLAGRGGEKEKLSCGLSPAEQRSRFFSLALRVVRAWAVLSPPCGHGDKQEGDSPSARRPGDKRHMSEHAVLTVLEALVRRKTSSAGAIGRRFFGQGGLSAPRRIQLRGVSTSYKPKC